MARLRARRAPVADPCTTCGRRAKIKLLAKKSIETGEDCDAIPDSMRHYLAVQAMESGKPLGPGLHLRTGVGLGTYGGVDMLAGAEPSNPSKVGE